MVRRLLYYGDGNDIYSLLGFFGTVADLPLFAALPHRHTHLFLRRRPGEAGFPLYPSIDGPLVTQEYIVAYGLL